MSPFKNVYPSTLKIWEFFSSRRINLSRDSAKTTRRAESAGELVVEAFKNLLSDAFYN